MPNWWRRMGSRERIARTLYTPAYARYACNRVNADASRGRWWTYLHRPLIPVTTNQNVNANIPRVGWQFNPTFPFSLSLVLSLSLSLSLSLFLFVSVHFSIDLSMGIARGNFSVLSHGGNACLAGSYWFSLSHPSSALLSPSREIGSFLHNLWDSPSVREAFPRDVIIRNMLTAVIPGGAERNARFRRGGVAGKEGEHVYCQ